MHLLRHLASRESIAWKQLTVSDADLARVASLEMEELAGQEFPALIDLASLVFLKLFKMRLIHLLVNQKIPFDLIFKVFLDTKF